MANPTTAWPANPAIDTGHAFYSGLRAFFPATGTTKVPVALLPTGAVVSGRPSSGYSGLGTGDLPTINSTGWASTPTASPTLDFGYSRRQIGFPGCGWGSAGSTSPRPNPSCWLGVIRVVMPQVNLIGPGNVAVSSVVLSCSGSNFGAGIALTVPIGTSSNPQLSFYRTGDVYLSSGITLTNGQEYAVAVMADATTTRKFFVYDYTAQSLLTASGGTGVVDSSATVTLSTDIEAALNYCGPQQSYYLPFLGRWGGGMLWSGTLDDTLFQSFYEDPYGVVRGTYAPSASTLTAGDWHFGDANTTQVFFTASRPTGGASSGDYTATLHRSTTANYTPGAGTAQGSAVAFSGAPSLTFADTPPDATVTYFYKLVASDGTNSVTYIARAGRCFTLDTIKLGVIGDSISAYTITPPAVHASRKLAVDLDCKVTMVNRARFSSATSHATAATDWTPGRSGGLFDAALAAFQAESVTHVLIALATNDADASMSAATYQANLAAIANALVAAGITPILQIPPLRQAAAAAFTETQINLLFAYHATMEGIANGSTIRIGNKDRWNWSLIPRAEFADETHPTWVLAAEALGMADAGAFADVIAPASGGGGGTVFGTVEG